MAIVGLLAGSLLTCAGIWWYIRPHILEIVFTTIDRYRISFWEAIGYTMDGDSRGGLATPGYKVLRIGLPAIMIITGVSLIMVATGEMIQ